MSEDRFDAVLGPKRGSGREEPGVSESVRDWWQRWWNREDAKLDLIKQPRGKLELAARIPSDNPYAQYKFVPYPEWLPADSEDGRWLMDTFTREGSPWDPAKRCRILASSDWVNEQEDLKRRSP